VAVLQRGVGVFVSWCLRVGSAHGLCDCIDQPLPGNPGVKDGTSARSIPVMLSSRFSFAEAALT